jgi:hypothetical protein
MANVKLRAIPTEQRGGDNDGRRKSCCLMKKNGTSHAREALCDETL